MRIEVRRFRHIDAEAVQRLNQRLAAGNCPHRLYNEDLSGNPEADLEVRPINDSLFVAADGDEVRGGSWLREQYFWIDGARQRIGWMKYPVSESLVASQYAGVPASMVLQLLRRQPNLMALGMGGHDAPFARLLAGIRWKASTIPFFFRLSRPFRVLRGLTYARRRWWVAVGMDIAGWSGLGWIASRLLAATARSGQVAGTTVYTEERFTPWADQIWKACRGGYAALAVRDAKTLDYLYPMPFHQLDRLRVSRAGNDVGWACAQILPSKDDVKAYFGNLRVGVVTDMLALPGDAFEVFAAAVEHLERLGVDLVITNVSHGAWIQAARDLRFLSGPSNLAFYQSPQAAELLLDGGTLATRCHLTRSDCDGPKRP